MSPSARRHAVSSPRRKQKPRGIVGGGCNGCGDCETVCPVIKPNEFEMGMKPRKAIYINHPQVVPLLYTIDFDSCVKCGICVTACGREEGNRPRGQGRVRQGQGRDGHPRNRLRHLPHREERRSGDTSGSRTSSRASSSSGSSAHPARPAATWSARAMARPRNGSHSCSVQAPVTTPGTASPTARGSAACIR